MLDLTAGTRLRPLKAMHAFRVLRDTGDTRQVFVILRAMRGRALIDTFRRFSQSALGQKVLAERRDLFPALTDREGLRKLPDGSLGRAYLAFMEEEQLSAQGLVQASESWEDDPMPPDIDLFRARMRELHDVSHVVTGYGRDPLGELCLLAFAYRQFGNLGRLLIVPMAWRQIPKRGRAGIGSLAQWQKLCLAGRQGLGGAAGASVGSGSPGALAQAAGALSSVTETEKQAEPPEPHEPEFFRQKAREMLKQADQAIREDDRQVFRALAEAYERLAKVAVRPHI